MEFKTDWDIDSYKTDYESDEHWQLRRSFMEKHKEKFAEDELVCLAQVFTNVEFLGCRYPLETMKKIALLSDEVATEFRKNRSTKLKRTFVCASDAAEAKFKGHTIKSDNNINSQDATNNKTLDIRKTINFTQPEKHIKKKIQMKGNKYKNFVILEDSEISADHTIARCAAIQKIDYKLEYTSIEESNTVTKNLNKMFVCKIYVHNIELATAKGLTKKQSASLAREIALANIRKCSYTLKPRTYQGVIIKPVHKNTDYYISNGNIGYKIMLKLGWDGGQLGSKLLGNVNSTYDPIKIIDNIALKTDRKGIGLEPENSLGNKSNLDEKYFINLLNEYKFDENQPNELVFSVDFTKAERAFLHLLGQKFHLKTKSKNSEGNRYLIIGKQLNLEKIVTDILNDGQSKKFYELQPPTDG